MLTSDTNTEISMVQVLLIGAGGFVGAVARYGIVSLAQSTWASSLPIGTLIVNVTGCLAVGWLSELFQTRPFLDSEVRGFLIIGLLGSFTTFSAFGHETVTLLRNDGAGLAGVNVAANVLLTIAAVWLGRAIGQSVG